MASLRVSLVVNAVGTNLSHLEKKSDLQQQQHAPASVSSLLSQPDIRLSGRPLASRTTDFMPLMLHDPVASISSSCPARPESEPRSSCKARLPT